MNDEPLESKAPRPRAWWIASSIILSVLSCLLAGYCYFEYRTTLAQEFRAIESQAQLGDAHLSGALRLLELVLDVVIDEENDILRQLPQGTQKQHPPLLQRYPEISHLIIVDRFGVVKSVETLGDQKDIDKIRGLDVSQREYFTFHQNAAPASLNQYHLSRPFTAVTERFTVTFSKAIRGENGTFDGVAVLLLSLQYFDSILRKVISNDIIDAAAIHDRFGNVIYRLPDPEQHIGRNIAKGEAFKLFLKSGQNLTRYVGVTATDNVERVLVFSKVGGSSLDVGVSSQLGRVMANWNQRLKLRIFAFIVFAGVFLLLVREILHRQDLKHRMEMELRRAATTDELTGLLNRRAFFSNTSRVLHIAIRQEKPLALLMIDIDHFKMVNDTFGHHAGDVVLQAFAENAQRIIRPQDIFARIGGEEFAILLFDPAEQALAIGERIRASVESQTIKELPHIHYTISVGVTTFLPQTIDDLKSAMRVSDANLYRAKTSGRNRVCDQEPFSAASVNDEPIVAS